MYLEGEAIPKALLPWLVNRGSLTKKLETLAEQSLIVERFSEGFQPVSHAINRELDLPKTTRRKQVAWVRQVVLKGAEAEPWVLAKSTFPSTMLQGYSRRLRHLGDTPIGYVLFARHKPLCQRTITTTLVQGVSCITRQNFYTWHGHTFLIEEIFLPALVERILAEDT